MAHWHTDAMAKQPVDLISYHCFVSAFRKMSLAVLRNFVKASAHRPRRTQQNCFVLSRVSQAIASLNAPTNQFLREVVSRRAV